MTSSDFPATSQPPAELRFVLSGPAQNRLSLAAAFPWHVGEVAQLELELVGRANEPLTRRRGRVLRAELVIDEERLNRVLHERLTALGPLLPPLGPVIEHVRVRIGSDAGGPYLQVLAQVRDDGIPLWCALRARLRACRTEAGPVRNNDPLALGLVDEEVRIYGLSATPAPLLGLLVRWAVGLALCAHPRAAPRSLSGTEPESRLGLRPIWATGVVTVGIELLHDALIATLPRAGYRVADPVTATLHTIRVEGGRLHLGYRSVGRRDGMGDESAEDWTVAGSDALSLGVPEALCLGDRLLLDGDYSAALSSYALVGHHPALAETALVRRRLILLTAPSRYDEAEQLFAEAVWRSAHDAQGRLALALLAGARGELTAAASQLSELAADPQSSLAGVVEERALLLLLAARCLTAVDLTAAAVTAQQAQALLAAAPGSDAAVTQEVAELVAELGQSAALTLALEPPAPAADGDADARAEEPELVLQRAAAETLPAALARIDRALRTLVGSARLRLCLGAARLCQQRGEIARARLYLNQAGEHPEALHQRVQLDLPELTVTAPGDLADLLPVLQRLQRRNLATRDELYALARLHSGRGQHRDAFAAQKSAGGDPEALLAALEAAGQPRALVDALLVHARLLPERAAELYRRAARVAQQQLADPARAAALWQAAAEALAAHPEEAAVLWAHAGHLWHSHGSYDRAEAALRKALEFGGEHTPLVLLALGHHAYAQANLDGAADAYRRALGAEQVPPAERPQVFLRLAEIEHERGDAAAEERELAAAVEAGGGALAWPALAALFRASGDGARLGASLLGWADYESGELRRSLLTQAAALCGPSLIGRADEELARLDADDEAVRDRVQTRLRQAGALSFLLVALGRDLEKSQGLRRLTVARELRELATRLGHDAAAARAHIAIIEGLAGGDLGPGSGGGAVLVSAADALAALAFLTDAHRASGALPDELAARLRALLLQKGRLRELQTQMDRQLALLTEHRRERSGRFKLLRQTAELAELLGDSVSAATRWLRLCGADPEDLDALARCRRLLRRLATSGQAALALALCETELRRAGDSSRRAHGLRIIQAELLLFLDRAPEALGQLELVLMRAETLGPAHALVGMLLATSPHAGDPERSVEHLLFAAYAPDVEPHEAGECALVAADLVTSASGQPGLPAVPRLLPTDLAADSAPSYLGRTAAGTWVAVPADFLDEAIHGDAARAPSTISPARLAADGPQVVSDTPPPAPDELPRAPAEPRALLLHAAALLPADPRPLEGLLGLSWSAREYTQALAYCERLLALATSPGQRARLLVEKAYVLLRTGDDSTAHALLDEALALLPEYPPALRALRLLVRQGGDLEQALALLQRELHAIADNDRPGRAALLFELGQLHKLRGDAEAALEAFREAGQLGSATAWRLLAELLIGRRDVLGAADAMGRAAALLPVGERGAALVEAAQLAVRADDELRARDHLEQAVALGGMASEAARTMLLELDGGPDATERRRTLERRLHQVSEGIGYIDVLSRLLLLCRTQADEAATTRYGEALLAHKPGDELALCALAEQAYRHGRLDEAEALLTGVTAVPEALERPGTLLRCLAELRARRGDLAGAEHAYFELLARGEHDSEADAVLAATTALAELLAQRGAFADVAATLKVRLLYLPEAPSAAASLRERIALRLRIAEAAERSGDLAEAEHQLGCVLEEQPGHREALRRMRLVYTARGDEERVLATLATLITNAPSPRERADWLGERATLLSERGELAAATADCQLILELIPGDSLTQRRLADLARRASEQALAAAKTQPLPPTRLPGMMAASGVELPGPATADAGLPAERPRTATELAAALCALRLPVTAELTALDAVLDQSIAALGGDVAALGEALRRRLFSGDGLNLGAVQALSRLAERADTRAQHVYLALLAFIAPGGAAESRLNAIGPRPLPTVEHPKLGDLGQFGDEEEPWLRALALGARLLGGLPAASLPLSFEWATRLLPLAQRLGLPRLTVALVDELRSADDPLRAALGPADPTALDPLGSAEPARCDPTQPPRLRLRRTLTAELGQAHFAALRALHLYCAGEPLLRWLDATDMAALLRAAAALWIPGLTVHSPRQAQLQALLQPPHPPAFDLADAWLAELNDSPAEPQPAPPHDPATVTPEQAAAILSPCLLRLHAEPGALEELRPLLLERMQQRALAHALSGLGDVLAALRAMALPPPSDADAARRALTRGALGEIVQLALRLYET